MFISNERCVLHSRGEHAEKVLVLGDVENQRTQRKPMKNVTQEQDGKVEMRGKNINISFKNSI